jgi:hypothetical protein
MSNALSSPTPGMWPSSNHHGIQASRVNPSNCSVWYVATSNLQVLHTLDLPPSKMQRTLTLACSFRQWTKNPRVHNAHTCIWPQSLLCMILNISGRWHVHSDAHLIRLITYRWWLTTATLTIPRTETKSWLLNILALRAIFLNYQTWQVSSLSLSLFATRPGLLLSLPQT